MNIAKNNKVKPQKHHYMISVIGAVIIMIVAIIYYYNSSFSSVQQSMSVIEQMPSVKEAHFEGDKNKLFVTCENGKQIQIELEDSHERYRPVIADFCS